MNYISETRNFLKNYKHYAKANKNLRDKLERIEEELDGYKAVVISDMPRGGGATEPDDRICNLIFEKDRITELLEKNASMIDSFKNAMKDLPEEHKKILMMSYVEEVEETRVINTLNISRATYYRVKDEAVKCLGKQLFGIVVDGYI